MTYYFYVYLKLDENRLVISENEINDSNYFHLMNNNSGNRQILFNSCKLFCLGYLYGSNNNGRCVINDPQEFA